MIFCRHKRVTFPMTLAGSTYVACLDCGTEFDYDWERMVRGKRRSAMAVTTIKLVGLRAGGATEFDGKYLVDYDPTPLDCGDVLISVSDDRAGARRFASKEAALAVYRAVSRKGPRLDGEPDRPLTAFSVEIETT